MKRSLVLASLLVACGGGAATSGSDPSGPRPVRVDSTESSASEGEAAHPVRVAPTIPGEAAETDDLADPPPVEAPTAH